MLTRRILRVLVLKVYIIVHNFIIGGGVVLLLEPACFVDITIVGNISMAVQHIALALLSSLLL